MLMIYAGIGLSLADTYANYLTANVNILARQLCSCSITIGHTRGCVVEDKVQIYGRDVLFMWSIPYAIPSAIPHCTAGYETLQVLCKANLS